ncbi:MAG: hypothetical protein IJ588_13790 [Prevotella sp.]|nr:hypothetical protein [Prevotella sp.]
MPTSLLTSTEKLQAAVSRFGPDYTALVFSRYQKPPDTMPKAAASTAPTLCDVTNYFSRDATLMWLRFHVAETFAFLGIYDTASKGQILQTAELILDHEVFSQLNLHEFLLFLSRFKRGDYGKIYQSARPNPQEFLQCLRPFWNELAEQRILAHQQEEERERKRREAEDRDLCMSYEEYQEIKMLTNMYNPPKPYEQK